MKQRSFTAFFLPPFEAGLTKIVKIATVCPGIVLKSVSAGGITAADICGNRNPGQEKSIGVFHKYGIHHKKQPEGKHSTFLPTGCCKHQNGVVHSLGPKSAGIDGVDHYADTLAAGLLIGSFCHDTYQRFGTGLAYKHPATVLQQGFGMLHSLLHQWCRHHHALVGNTYIFKHLRVYRHGSSKF